MGYQTLVRRGLRLPSGRVVAIGRYMLASLIMLFLWFDASPMFGSEPLVTGIAAGYLLFALALVTVTWNNWWLDAKFAGPALAVDIGIYALLIYSIADYDSPYFTFFVFVLFSSAIRWGWRATTLTAVLMISLFLLAGMVIADKTTSDIWHNFVDRSGHLAILSLLLIWFGVNQWRSGMHMRTEVAFADPAVDESPLETGLRAAMQRMDAGSGVLVWREHGGELADALVARDEEILVVTIEGEAFRNEGRPFLYHVRKDHSLVRDESGNLHASGAVDQLNLRTVAPLKLTEGLAVPLKTGAGIGELFLEQIPNLSTDHIDIADDLAQDLAGHIERHALFRAVEESAEARSRLALARDLHDSVVQFLAGAAFRLEALKRDLGSGQNLEPELNYLKQLMLQEQGELRSFIAALRSAPKIGLNDLTNDLRALSERLAEQWNVLCEFTANTTDMMVPSRLHLDAQHLVREAMANAVRHAGAKKLTIRLKSEPENLKLDFINDGSRYPKSDLQEEMPKTLSERVKLAGGVLELSRGMGVTRISVVLPISGRV